MDTEIDLPRHRRRSSAFTETGLEGHDTIIDEKIRSERPRLSVRFRSNVSIVEPNAVESEPSTPVAQTAPITAPPTSILSQIPFAQLALLVALLAITFPTFNGLSPKSNLTPALAEASPMAPRAEGLNTLPVKRQTDSADVCKRWSGQSALINGTVYYYGGRATTSADQTTNEWSKLLSLVLPKPD